MELHVRISEINANKHYIKLLKKDIPNLREKLMEQVEKGKVPNASEYLDSFERPIIESSLNILRFLGASDLTILRARRRKYSRLSNKYDKLYYEQVESARNEGDYIGSPESGVKTFKQPILSGVYYKSSLLAADEAQRARDEIAKILEKKHKN